MLGGVGLGEFFDEGASGPDVGAAAWSLWRPKPPPGYASLGDVATFGVSTRDRPRSPRS